jgi:hypothetical protein
MIGTTVSHYTILSKLGEVPIRPDLASDARLSPLVELSIPPLSGGSCIRRGK